MWENVRKLFVGYMGEGLIWCMFLVALIFLFIYEKDRVNRILFLYTPVMLLLIFFNPLFMNVLYGFIGEQIYYRILWLIPAGMVLGYSVVRIYMLLQGEKQVFFLLICFLSVVSAGKLIYTNPQYSVADNLYHVPEEVVMICDAIEIEGREVIAAFPEELVQYVRQYSPYICMPYGREVLVPKWKSTNELHVAMSEEAIEVSEVSRLAKQQGCQYIVINMLKQRIGDFTEHGYEKVMNAGIYEILKDKELASGL